MERALVAALAPEGLASGQLGYEQLVVDGLVGWGGLAGRARLAPRNLPAGTAPEPNIQLWQHLGDLAALRDQLRRRLG
jgi:hypothetical protein